MRTSVRFCLGAGVLAGALTIAGAAAAMPLAKIDGAGPAVEDVRYGCGPGWAPNRWGECVPVRRRYYRPPPPPMFFDPWGPPRFRHHHYHHRRDWY